MDFAIIADRPRIFVREGLAACATEDVGAATVIHLRLNWNASRGRNA
jgi:hypothetical protein